MRDSADGLQHCLSFPGERRQMVLPENARAPERDSVLTQVEVQAVLEPEIWKVGGNENRREGWLWVTLGRFFFGASLDSRAHTNRSSIPLSQGKFYT